jgi:hypothetical protein
MSTAAVEHHRAEPSAVRSFISAIIDKPKPGRPKGTKNREGHRAGRPRKPAEQFAPSVWERGKRVIRVEAEHIARAVERSSSACAIADALKQQIPNARHVAVDLQCIRWTDCVRKIRYIALTPA